MVIELLPHSLTSVQPPACYCRRRNFELRSHRRNLLFLHRAATVNFLAKLVALKPRDTMLGMIRNVMQEKDEGVDNAGNDNEGNAERVSATGRKSHLVHPGMFLETVSNEFEVSRVSPM
ncbi:uncharacterized protein DS421_12g364660 [Arachis hypogaea]|nr:uncharacterized protein DS421_12g364660 [Arachis hypogaea]